MSTKLTFAYVKPSRVFSATGNDLFYTDGNVGIGKANPSTRLDVSGNVTISGNVNVDSGLLFIDGSNNRIGVGTTSPSVALDVSGDVNVSSGATLRVLSTSTDTRIVSTSNNGNFGSIECTQNSNNANKRALTLNAYGGNVGVGKTNPASELDVNGSIMGLRFYTIDSTISLFTSGINLFSAPSGTAGMICLSSISGINAKYIGVFEWTNAGTSASVTAIVTSGAISVYHSGGFVGASTGNNSNTFRLRVMFF